MAAADCEICRIVAGEAPSARVAEDERTVAFLDPSPATRGHVVVAPREHSADLSDVPPEDLAACARAAQQLAVRAKERLDADGVNLVSSPAGHFHLDVIPRYAGQTVRVPWAAAPGDRDEIAATAAELTR